MKAAKTALFSGAMLLFLFGGIPCENLLGQDSSPGLSSLVWADEGVEYSNKTPVEPWESFRGWNPRVPYGQSSATRQPDNESPNEKEADSTLENKKSDSSESNPSSAIVQDDVKPWQSFRGWSREVPYSRNY